jgi:hypothetical protein
MDMDHDNFSTGCLIKLLQRGLQYMELEANTTQNDGASADTKFEILTAGDILQAKTTESLKTLVRDRRDDDASSKSKPSFKSKHCQDSGFVLKGTSPLFTCRWNASGDMLACYSQSPDARIVYVGSSFESTQGGGKDMHEVLLHQPGNTVSLSAPVVWRPDGLQVAAGMESGTIHLWHPDGAVLSRGLLVIFARGQRRCGLALAGSLPCLLLVDTGTGCVAVRFSHARGALSATCTQPAPRTRSLHWWTHLQAGCTSS